VYITNLQNIIIVTFQYSVCNVSVCECVIEVYVK